MSRSVERSLWLLAAVAGVTTFLGAGFYGWASILVWTVFALPLTLQARHIGAGSGKPWPASRLNRIWGAAIALSVAGGLSPFMTAGLAGPTWVGWLIAAVGWAGLILSIATVASVTYSRFRQPAGAQSGAA